MEFNYMYTFFNHKNLSFIMVYLFTPTKNDTMVVSRMLSPNNVNVKTGGIVILKILAGGSGCESIHPLFPNLV